MTEIKKSLRRKLKSETGTYKRNILKQRIKIVREHITRSLQEARGEKIRRVAENIRNRTNNGGQIWELKKKLKRKPRMQKQLTSEDGKILAAKEDILMEYKKYYQGLLTMKESSSVEEVDTEIKEFEKSRNLRDSRLK